MLSFAHLEALIAIADLGSFRAAAKRLSVTQPTVSMRIRELEHSLDTPLFDRSSYRPQLTANGREILKYAQRMMALMRDMRACALNGAGVVGTIRLGAADSFALTCLPSLLAELEHRFPRLRVALDIDYSFNLNHKLHRGDLDIAFLTSPTAGPAVRIEPLVPIPLVWVASPRLGLPETRLIAADLADMPIITNPEPSNLYTSAIEWFGRAGLEPTRLSSCNSLTHMVRLTAAGVGVSLLPTAILHHEIESGMLHILETDPPIEPHSMAIAVRCTPTSADLSLVQEIARGIVANSDMAENREADGRRLPVAIATSHRAGSARRARR
jgi:DNA-binding transcriptional LysR family regulator